MSYDIIESKDVLYSYLIMNSTNIVESFNTRKSQYCYACAGLTNCYKLFYSIGCNDCSDSYFIADCK